MKFFEWNSPTSEGSSTVSRLPTNLDCGMDCICAPIGCSSPRSGSQRAESGETPAAAFDLPAGAGVEATELESSKKPPGKIFTSRMLNRWQLSRQSCFEKLGTASGLMGAWIDLELLTVSRSLKS